MSAHRSVILSLFALCFLGGDVLAQRGFSPEVQRQLEALKDEPSVREAQKAALKFFNIDPESVTSMRSRAAAKGLMPSLEARYRHNASNLDVDTLNTTIDDNPFLFDRVNGSVNEIQVGVRWNLPLLVFNAEVLDVGSLAILQEGVLKEITRLYYTRRRLQIDLILNPPRDAGTLVSKELRIEELTSTIDAMTGNIFSKHQERSRRLRRRGGFKEGGGDVFRPLGGER